MFKFLYNFWFLFFKFLNNSNFFFKKLNNLAQNFSSLSYFYKLLVILFYMDVSNKNLQVTNFRRQHFPLIHTHHLSFYQLNYNKPIKLCLKKFNKEINFLASNSSDYIEFTKFFQKNIFFNYYFLVRFFNKHYQFLFNNYGSIKLNLFLFQLIETSSNVVKIFNLNFCSHWYKYNFDKNNFVLPLLSFNGIYNSFKLKNNFYKNNFYLNTDLRNLSFVALKDSFILKLKQIAPINFSETSTNKHINLNKLKEYCFFYIRKNRIFNKGRYSRNRQLYRTGFYWCLYFNIISVYGLYFIFYRVVFNFGYLWLFLVIFFGSFLFSRALKYNFTNINFVTTEISKSFTWFSYFLSNAIDSVRGYLFSLFASILNLKIILINNGLTFFNVNGLFAILEKHLLNFDNFKFNFFWKTLNTSDSSFFKIKTIINYFSQMFGFVTKSK